MKVIVFGDYAIDEKPMEEFEFFTLVGETNDEDKFEAFLKKHVVADGGGNTHRNALEAIAKALMSDWYKEQDRCRHIVIVFTDAEALPLRERAGCGDYDAQGYPENIEELASWLEGNNSDLKYDESGGRLLLFAPDAYPRNYISAVADRTFTAYSKAGTGLSDAQIAEIIRPLTQATWLHTDFCYKC